MKAQIAAEFVLYSMLAIVMVTALMALIGADYGDKKDERVRYEIASIGRQIQKELIVASEVKPGFKREIFIPYQVLGENISVSNTNTQIAIIHEKGSQYFNTPTITGTFVKGKNNITTNETTLIIN